MKKYLDLINFLCVLYYLCNISISISYLLNISRMVYELNWSRNSRLHHRRRPYHGVLYSIPALIVGETEPVNTDVAAAAALLGVGP